MPIFISDGPLGICDRCRVKMLLKELSPDRDSPGLNVCRECNDVRDPWRSPFHPKDTDISVDRPSPDEDLVLTVTPTVNEQGTVEDGPIPVDTSVYPRSD